MTASPQKVARVLPYCSSEFVRLAEVRLAGCPALQMQMRTFEKLIINAEQLGWVESKREGSVKLVRLTDKGRDVLAND